MNTQAIEYQGCRIELQGGGRYEFGRDKDCQWADIRYGERVIVAFGENVVEQAKALLNEAPFDDWFSYAGPDFYITGKGCGILNRCLTIDYPQIMKNKMKVRLRIDELFEETEHLRSKTDAALYRRCRLSNKAKRSNHAAKREKLAYRVFNRRLEYWMKVNNEMSRLLERYP